MCAGKEFRWFEFLRHSTTSRDRKTSSAEEKNDRARILQKLSVQRVHWHMSNFMQVGDT